MAVPWPTHRVKATQAKALRRRHRRRASAAAKAEHQAQQRRPVTT